MRSWPRLFNLLLATCAFTSASAPALAELEKVQVPCDGAICVHWLPKLPSIAGWHRDEQQGQKLGIVALVPEGYDFGNAEYIIYARAIQKTLQMDNPSLAGFIAQDAEDYKALYPGIKVAEGNLIKTANHQALRTLILIPAKTGRWEQITYHEDGSHFVILVLSSKTDTGFKKSRNQYLNLLSRY